jgi:Pyruvate/2-oxoacid:ferredoxin oxidoreductase delta subunit
LDRTAKEKTLETGDVYRELCKKLGVEDSRFLPEIWKLLCSPEEAALVNATPATTEALARILRKTPAEIEKMIHVLFRKGVLFEGSKGYHMSRSLVQFHDATALWPEAPPELITKWRQYVEEEYPRYYAWRLASQRPPVFRVIPVNRHIENQSRVLVYEDARRILEKASLLAVTPCPCRTLMRNCDRPLETCLQMNKGAAYAVKRGTGRAIDLEEAEEILIRAEESGLVHMTGNRAAPGTVICNCCACCCIALSYEKDARTGTLHGQVNPSRYRAAIQEDRCIGCGVCETVCPMKNIVLNERGKAEVLKACLGCGLCTRVCPEEAVRLVLIRPEEHIPPE